ncbi:MAG: hypothetical protein AAF441_17300, partial [Pseudomonadota bacterium]
CKTAGTNAPERQQVPQVDPTTYVYNDRTYSVVHRPVAGKTFEVEVAGLAQVLTPAPADGQLAVNVAAQFLAHRGLCGGFTVPAMIQGTQNFDPKHEYWKQTFRCP